MRTRDGTNKLRVSLSDYIFFVVTKLDNVTGHTYRLKLLRTFQPVSIMLIYKFFIFQIPDPECT